MVTCVTPAARTIPAAVRRAVVARDGYVCQHCGRAVVRRSARDGYFPDTLHLDHLHPWAAGGEHTVENLVVSCAACNIRRRPPKRTIIRTLRHPYIVVRGGAHYWVNGGRPVIPADIKRPLRLVTDAATDLGVSTPRVIDAVMDGLLAATRSERLPIRVELPAFPETWAAETFGSAVR